MVTHGYISDRIRTFCHPNIQAFAQFRDVEVYSHFPAQLELFIVFKMKRFSSEVHSEGISFAIQTHFRFTNFEWISCK